MDIFFNSRLKTTNSKNCKINSRTELVITSALCLLILGVLLLSFFTFNFNDFLAFLNWSVCILILALPSQRLFKRLIPFSADSAYFYSIIFSWLGIGFLTWFSAHLGLPVFTSRFVQVILIVAILAIIALNILKKEPIKLEAKSHSTINQILLTTLIFLSSFALGIYFRTLKPEIYGLEKFMDYGFMMSMWRDNSLPAKDMWLAGHFINYYYFGQYLFTLLAKLTGIEPKISYNLSMAASFSITFTLAYSLIRDIIFYKIKENKGSNNFIANISGLLAALLLCLAGNSHAFFYRPSSLGHGLVKYLQRFGTKTGKISDFYFSDSTRFIGHNPDSSDKTIHEFPLYSYVVGDLHAHMINLSFVLLFLVILFAFYIYLRKAKDLLDKKTLIYASTLGFLLAIFSMTNYWDFAIYFVVTFLTLVAALLSRGKNNWLSVLLFIVQTLVYFIPFLLDFGNPVIKLGLYLIASICSYIIYRYKNDSLTISGFYLSFIFLISHLFSLQMNLNMSQMPKAFKLVQNNSSLYQLFILWAFHAAVGIIYIVYMFWANHNRIKFHLQEQNFVQAIANLPADNLFIFILVCCGLGLILVPEIIYLKDIYEVNFARANTMFKFTYQSFALLSLGAAYFFGELLFKFIPKKNVAELENAKTFNKNVNYINRESSEWNFKYLVPLLACTISLIIPFSYTSSISDWFDFSKEKAKRTLDGSRYIANLSVEDDAGVHHSLRNRLNLIDYLNENESTSVNILESYGSSYSDYASVSAYTGLSTVLGWETHEWLWRTTSFEESSYKNLIAPLQREINEFYTTNNKSLQVDFIKKNKIKYIVVGELERIKHPDINESALQNLGKIVFSSGNSYLIAVQVD